MIGVVAGFVTVCVLGAWARTALISLLDRPGLPVGTLGVNVLGSAIAGALHVRIDGDLATIAVVGALGAFTTFSTFAVQVADDLHDRRRLRAGAYVGVTLIGTVAAATIGGVLAG